MELAAEVTRRLDQSLAPESDASPRKQPRRRRLFMDAVRAVRAWLDHPAVRCEDISWLLRPDQRVAAAQAITEACLPHTDDDRIIGTFDSPPVLDTSSVAFETSLTDRHPVSALDRTRHSELNVAACHSGFERRVAAALDRHPDVHAWARNFRLDWTVPYEIDGVWHRYVPDFVVRLLGGRDSDDAVHLMLECKGEPDEVSEAKHSYVQDWWIPAVANSPETPRGLRRWTFTELTDIDIPESELDRAIEQARRRFAPPTRRRRRGLDSSGRRLEARHMKQGRTTDSYQYGSAKRSNLPTEQTEPLMSADDKAPRPFTPAGRERDDEPVLAWSREARPQTYDAHPLYVREKIHPGAFVQSLKSGKVQTSLFDDFNGLPSTDAAYEWYEHAGNWQNRLIHGESARVMASLAERERLSGRVQMIFFDPPYGIGFKSNFQVSTRNRETADNRKGLPVRHAHHPRLPRHLRTRHPLVPRPDDREALTVPRTPHRLRIDIRPDRRRERTPHGRRCSTKCSATRIE